MLDYSIQQHGLSISLIKGEKRKPNFNVLRKSQAPFSIEGASYSINTDPEETGSCNVNASDNTINFLLDTTDEKFEKGKSYQITLTVEIDDSSEVIKGRVTLKVI